MAIGRIGASTLSYAARTSISFAKPAGSEKGDLLLVSALLETETSPALALSGAAGTIWPARHGSSWWYLGTWWAIHDGTANPLVLTWGGTSFGCSGNVEVWRGVDPALPIEATAALVLAATQTPTAPTVTTLTANAVELIYNFNGLGFQLAETPAGYTLGTNGAEDIPSSAYRTRAEPGATGTTALKVVEESVTNLTGKLALRAAGAVSSRRRMVI